MTTLLVTGATGFVGSAVAQSIIRSRPETRVIWARHKRPFELPLGRSSDRIVTLDLADPGSIEAAVSREIYAVLHLAVELHGTDERLRAVNADACRTLVDACTAIGICRIVRLSTLAVYGRGPWSGVDESTLVPAPQSALSRSRLAGDETVLRAGGCVVRPHLVWGPGDRWVVPRMIEITNKVGWIEHGRARQSIIHVSDLAEILVSAALDDHPQAGVTIPHGTTLPIKDFLRPQMERYSMPIPNMNVTLPEALAHPAGRDDPRWQQDVAMIGSDHYLAPAQDAPSFLGS